MYGGAPSRKLWAPTDHLTQVLFMRALIIPLLACLLVACSESSDVQGCFADADCPEGQSCVFQGEETGALNACVPKTRAGVSSEQAGDASSEQSDSEGEADAEGDNTAPPCEPQCAGKNCGDNGCGGLCGTCFGTYTCEEGTCTPCQPLCEGKTCGDDACGGLCGECAEGEVCTASQCGPPPPPICLEMTPCLLSTCSESVDVLDECLSDALEACGPAVTPEQEDAALALVACMAENGCSLDQSANGAECQRIFCMDETVSCSQATSGELECHTILDCIEGETCEKNFATGEPTIKCIAQCLESASADAASKYWELMLCADGECIGNPDYTDMDLCFQDSTKNGGPCGWPLRDCLVTALN